MIITRLHGAWHIYVCIYSTRIKHESLLCTYGSWAGRRDREHAQPESYCSIIIQTVHNRQCSAGLKEAEKHRQMERVCCTRSQRIGLLPVSILALPFQWMGIGGSLCGIRKHHYRPKGAEIDHWIFFASFLLVSFCSHPRAWYRCTYSWYRCTYSCTAVVSVVQL